MGVSKEIKSETKTDNLMAKAQITVPLDIPDVRVLQTSVSERGEIIITLESTRQERNVVNVENGSRNYTDEMNG